MLKDTRITVAIALIYLLNGVVNWLGTAQTFMPFFFLDYFILALLALIYAFLPKFSPINLLMLLFAVQYAVLGFLSQPMYKNDVFELYWLIALFALNLVFYSFIALKYFRFHWFFVVPLALFLLINSMGYFLVNAWFVIALSGVLGLVQIYILARPDWLQHMNSLAKRYFLLNTMFFLFETIRFVFFYSIQ